MPSVNKPKIAKPGKKPTRHPEAGYITRARIWIEKDGELYLGGGRVILLERLDEMGSIAAAARSMKLSYRNAWLWIEAMNRLAPSPLVEKTAGGVHGGHARLTQQGHDAIAYYKKLQAKLEKAIEQECTTAR